MEHIWDILRPLDKLAVTFDIYLTPVILVVSLALFVIAASAYRKNPSRRFLLIATAFLFFAAQWVLRTIDLFVSPGIFFSIAAQDMFELIVLASLFLALFTK